MSGGHMDSPARQTQEGRGTLETRGRRNPQNLAATLTAAGLDDPDILALAAEADALRLQSKIPLKTSRGGGLCVDSSLDGSPDSPLIGTTPASPVKSPTSANRSGSLSPTPGRKPTATSIFNVPNAAAAAAARKSSVGGYPISNSNGGYVAAATAAAASRAASPPPGSRGLPAVVESALTRKSSLGHQQQQQQQELPPHAVAFGTTVPVSSVPQPATKKISNSGAVSPVQLARKSSLGKDNTHFVVFGSTMKSGNVSPAREHCCSITRGASLPNSSVSPSRQSSNNISYAATAIARGSSLGAPGNGGLSRKNSTGAEAPRVAFWTSWPPEISSDDRRVSGIGRSDSKNSNGGGRCTSASPTRSSRTPGAASTYSGAAKPASKVQAVTSPFAAAASRPLDSPTPNITHTTFTIDNNSVTRSSSLGRMTGCNADSAAIQAAAAAAAATAAAGSNKHRRTPSLPSWPPENESADERSYAQNAISPTSPTAETYTYVDTSAAAAASSNSSSSSVVACDPSPAAAALPIELAGDRYHEQETDGNVVGSVRVGQMNVSNDFAAYLAGHKLPVLTEELSHQLSQLYSQQSQLHSQQMDKDLNSGGGSSATGAGWSNLFIGGNKKSKPSRFSGLSADGSVTGSVKESLRVHSATGERRTSGSSNSSGQVLVTNQNKQKSKSRLLCLGLPLFVIAVVAAAVVGGIYGSKAHAGGVAEKSQDMMTFQVTVSAPAKSAAQGCSGWFGGGEKISQFKGLVSSAYASALDMSPSDTTVRSVTCGGSSVYSSSGASYARTAAASRSARLLLKDVAAPIPQSTSSWVDITTVFSVPAPTDVSRRSQILETVSSASSGILSGPLSQFFGVQDLMIKCADAVSASSTSSRGPQAPRATPANDSELLSPEAGEMTADLPLASDTSAALLPTDAGTGNQSGITVSIPDTAILPPSSAADSQSSSITVPAVPAVKVQPPTELQLSTFPWNPIKNVEAYAEAPACLFSPTAMNTVTDAHGRLWSLMNNHECAFRPDTDNARIGTIPVTWDTADICPDAPTKTNFVLDSNGKMWGWQKDKTCAFRARYPKTSDTIKPVLTAKPLAVPAKVSVVWDNAPVCPFAPTKMNIVPDVFGRLWSWENGRSCAFRYTS